MLFLWGLNPLTFLFGLVWLGVVCKKLWIRHVMSQVEQVTCPFADVTWQVNCSHMTRRQTTLHRVGLNGVSAESRQSKTFSIYLMVYILVNTIKSIYSYLHCFLIKKYDKNTQKTRRNYLNIFPYMVGGVPRLRLEQVDNCDVLNYNTNLSFNWLNSFDRIFSGVKYLTLTIGQLERAKALEHLIWAELQIIQQYNIANNLLELTNLINKTLQQIPLPNKSNLGWIQAILNENMPLLVDHTPIIHFVPPHTKSPEPAQPSSPKYVILL